MHWPTHLRETATYLLEMVDRPGWTEHARHRRDELLADPMYGRELKEEILRAKAAASPSPSAPSTPSTGASTTCSVPAA
jgi:hypothetical protein